VLNVPQLQKSFGTHPMELQGDVGHVESRFGPFGDSVGVMQDRCRFVLNIPQAQKSFWTHPIVPLGDEAQVDA
jgi:hypothetical protein